MLLIRFQLSQSWPTLDGAILIGIGVVGTTDRPGTRRPHGPDKTTLLFLIRDGPKSFIFVSHLILILSCLFDRWRNWGSNRYSDVPRIMQLTCGIPTQVIKCPNETLHCFAVQLDFINIPIWAANKQFTGHCLMKPSANQPGLFWFLPPPHPTSCYIQDLKVNYYTRHSTAEINIRVHGLVCLP